MTLTYEERLVLKQLVSDAKKAKVATGDRHCEHCGETFTPSWTNHAQQIYCTRKCRDAVHLARLNEQNRRKREARAAA